MSKQETSPAAAQTEDTEPVNFEKAMAELEQLVSQMEEGDLSLDDSLQAFERGIKLTRQCQHALSQAELKVKTLTAANTLEELTQEDA
jgi:exodeoxyribonuclease VII small subunit